MMNNKFIYKLYIITFLSTIYMYLIDLILHI